MIIRVYVTFESCCSELRNPLHVIVGYTELRTENQIPESEYMTCLVSAANLMKDIVNDVLDLSKIERGHMEASLHFSALLAVVFYMMEHFSLLIRSM